MPPKARAADPYAGFETRVVPENVTLLPKTKEQVTGGNPTGERIHVVKKGDTVTSILRDQGATPEEAKAIATTLGPRGRDGGLKEGQKLRILMAPAGPGQRAAALSGDRRQRFHGRSRRRAVRYRQIRRRRRAEHEHRRPRPPTTADDDDDDDGTGVRLYQSIYETALRNKVPPSVIDDMIRIYSYDVDFQRKVQPGDSFDVFFAGEDEGSDHHRKNRGAVRLAHGRRRDQEILPLPDPRRLRRRLLRRDRQEREEVPGPQARQQRDHALRLRQPPPSDPRLRQDAHRRRLGHAPTARRFLPPATASSKSPAGKAATANTSS